MVAFPLESYLNLGEGRKIPSSGILREVFVADALVGNFRGPRRALCWLKYCKQIVWLGFTRKV